MNSGVKNSEVFRKEPPVQTLMHMNEMLVQSCGNSTVCIMNALMSKEEASERCSRYPKNKDGSKCRSCIIQWLNE